MGTSNRVFGSPDPGDQFADPLDQANGNPAMECLGAPAVLAAALDVRALRERMRLTQRQFAGWFGFSIATLRHWERGNRKPAGTALVLLHVIRENPRVVLQAVRKARLLNSGVFPPIEPVTSRRAPPGFGERYAPIRQQRRRKC